MKYRINPRYYAGTRDHFYSSIVDTIDHNVGQIINLELLAFLILLKLIRTKLISAYALCKSE